ncbi:putative RNA 3'-terminal phosphate cyclase-like protein [Lycorma delicatula]|uniref:putative RNA 3'-terminal phosphate cyclase-like protein n=1 Tax=Lycorma delicatula TaxID=130591 RepID=UPI003F51221F
MAADNSDVLCFKGSNYMRQRLLLSVVSGKAIRITDIRTPDDEPGLKVSVYVQFAGQLATGHIHFKSIMKTIVAVFHL